MKSISQRLDRQSELLEQLVHQSTLHGSASASHTSSVSAVDARSPPHYSVPRDRTPEVHCPSDNEDERPAVVPEHAELNDEEFMSPRRAIYDAVPVTMARAIAEARSPFRSPPTEEHPGFLLRSAAKNEAASAKKLPAERPLFETDGTHSSESESSTMPPSCDTTSSMPTAVTVPVEFLEHILAENDSLKHQLDWSLRKCDAFRDRLVELSPAH